MRMRPVRAASASQRSQSPPLRSNVPTARAQQRNEIVSVLCATINDPLFLHHTRDRPPGTLVGCGKPMLACETCETSEKGVTGGTSETGKTRGGAQSVQVAPFSLVSRVARPR